VEPIRRDEWPFIVAGGAFLLLFGVWGVLLTLAMLGMARAGRRFGARFRPLYRGQGAWRGFEP
jgi:hypothetical protein